MIFMNEAASDRNTQCKNTGAAAKRDSSQTQDYKGEFRNVNDTTPDL